MNGFVRNFVKFYAYCYILLYQVHADTHLSVVLLCSLGGTGEEPRCC